METNQSKVVSIRDTSDARWVTLRGIGTIHKIGLDQTGRIRNQLLYNDDSDDDNTDSEGEVDDICVDLLQISICDTGGTMIAPMNNDLYCTMNGEELLSEMNLISGSVVHIADKKLKIFDGPPIRERKKLPPTPGVYHPVAPPPKPHRNTQDVDHYTPPLPALSPSSTSEEMSDWYLVHSPIIDIEIIQSLDTPEKLGNMAASFLSRQIHLYTDAKLSTSATDEVFKFLQNVAMHQKHLLVTYLTEMSKTYEEMPEAERDKPVHSPAIKLLVEILRQILDPLSHVVLALQMIRTFSHFSKNVVEIVRCQATPAILGCMAVYKDVAEVQEYGMDILAKIATYKNKLNEKIPIRETGVEMILRTLKHHSSNADIVQPGCRTLTRLTSTIQEMLDQMLNTEYQFCTETEAAIEQYEALLKHIFEQAIPVVQDALQLFPNNLSVTKEGRHFLYNSSKMEMVVQKKKNRLLKSFSAEENCSNDFLQAESETVYMAMANAYTKVNSKEGTKGILKKSSSFEIVQNSHFEDRKVRFVDDDNPDSFTSSGAFSSDSDGGRSFEPRLEIQETKILQATDLKSRFHSSKGLNDSFERTFQLNKELLNSVETEKSLDDWFAGLQFKNDGSESPDLMYEVMNSSLEDSALVNRSQRSVENIYETVDFLCSGDISAENVTKNQNSDDHLLKGDNSASNSVQITMEENSEIVVATDIVNEIQEREEREHFCQSDSEPKVEHTVAEVLYLTKVVHAQIVQYICGLVIDGENSQALYDVDQPITSLLTSADAPQGLQEFINREFKQGKTIMDTEPSLAIKIIDAVHYRSVLHDLLQTTILDVISGFGEVKDQHVLSLAMSSIAPIFKRENLHDIIHDKEFLSKVRGYIDDYYDKLQEIPETHQLTKIVYKEDILSRSLSNSFES